MNLAKSYDFFKPEIMDAPIYILGCGATGSVLIEMLARLGIKNIHIYDFDYVEEKNIANQMFRVIDIGKNKTEAVVDIVSEINPELRKTITIHNEPFMPGDYLEGYVFLCVDNIDLRREICEAADMNFMIKAIFDFRIGLTTCQHYAADWNVTKDKQKLLSTMQFSHEEANKDTPLSMCNEVMSVAPTNRMVVSIGVANFMNFMQTKTLKHIMLIDAFNFTIDIIA